MIMKKLTVFLMFVNATPSCLRYREVKDSDSEAAVSRDEQTVGDVYFRKSAFPDGKHPERVKLRIYVG